MMMDAVLHDPTEGYDYRHLDRIREKFTEVFGRECTLRDETLRQRYTLTPEGDLVMLVR